MVLGYYMAFMPVYIEKSGDLVGCYHSGTDDKQKRKDRATQPMHCNGPRTAEMSNKKMKPDPRPRRVSKTFFLDPGNAS